MPDSNLYRDRILKLYDSAIETLLECNIPRETIDYRLGYATPRRPTSAHSNFLINRQFGDWTEAVLCSAFNRQFREYRCVRYGAGGNLIAGDAGFAEMFREYHAEISSIGKRPDLMIFDNARARSLDLPDDISNFGALRLGETARAAKRAIEVRSSRYLAAQYRRVKEREQSFTPKLEDLPILTHWVAEHNVPCFYTQVFFDEAHTISFERILQIVQQTGDEYIERVQRNQGKSTFYIPVTEGLLIGNIVEAPVWEANIRSMNDGRIIIYTTPMGGRLELRKEFLQYLELG